MLSNRYSYLHGTDKILSFFKNSFNVLIRISFQTESKRQINYRSTRSGSKSLLSAEGYDKWLWVVKWYD